MFRTFGTIALFALAACGGRVTVEEASYASGGDACYSYYVTQNAEYLSILEARGDLSAQDVMDIQSNTIREGMPEAAIKCVFGEYGLNLYDSPNLRHYFYMGEYIKPHSVFVQNGRVVSWDLPHGGGLVK